VCIIVKLLNQSSCFFPAEVMNAEAAGHTYMHPEDRLSHTAALLEGITLEEVNDIARELCEHVSHMDIAAGVQPAAIIACAPVVDRAGESRLICHCRDLPCRYRLACTV
jgi:hypothetical protein